MNYGQFKDLGCYLCLAVSMVVSWSQIQEVAGSNNLYHILSLNAANSLKTFRENSSETIHHYTRLSLEETA